MPHGKSYRPDIDGLRAVAVMAVIVHHFDKGLLQSGYLGVDMFFVISGFVITSSLANRSSPSLRDFLMDFYVRRIKRLAPALIVCVLLTACVMTLVSSTPTASLRTGAAALLGLSNIYLFRSAADYFAASTELNAFTHTWSLGVEEQFYLLFPVLVWFSGLVRGQDNGRARLLRLLGAISIASFAAYLAVHQVNPSAAYFLMPTRLWELGAGCITYLLVSHTGTTRTQQARFISPSWVLIALVGVFFVPLTFNVVATVMAVSLTSLLIWALEFSRPALLTQKHVLLVGLMSYSLYLWHWSVLAISRWTIGVHWWSVPVQVALMFALAAASYRFIEQPLRNAEWSRFRKRSIAYGLLALAGGVAVLLLLDGPVKSRLFLGDNRVMALSGVPVYGFVGTSGRRASDCHSSDGPKDVLEGQRELTGDVISDCFQAGDDGAPLLAFVGDSHTLALFPLIDKLRSQADVSVFSHSRDGCAFPTQGPTRRSGCVEVMNSVSNFVLDEFGRRPGSVLVAMSSLVTHFGYDGVHRTQFLDHPSGRRSDVNANLAGYVGALAALSEQLGRRQASLVVVAPLPWHPGLTTEELCMPQWFRPSWAIQRGCAYSDRLKLEAERLHIVRALGRLANTAPNVYVYDGFPTLCQSAERCYTSSEGQFMYSDWNHLNSFGAQSLFDDFFAYLRQHSMLQRTP